MSQWKTIPIYEDYSPAAKKQALRLNALGSLFYFGKAILGHNRFSNNLHAYMCRQLEQDSLRLALEIPRDHFKTSVASVSAPMWWALPFNDDDEEAMRAMGYDDAWIRWMRRAHNPNTRTLIASEVLQNARKIGAKIAGHYESNSMFRFLFPEILPKKTDKWNQDSMTHSRLPGEYHGEGTFDFIGAKGALQSRHYVRQIIDDIVGEKAINSDLVMEATIDWIRKLPGAFDSDPSDPTRMADQLFIGNRWSQRDVGAWLRQNVSGMKFETHSAEGGCCSLHPAGVPIFPEEFSIEKLHEIKKIEGSYNYCTPAETPILMADFSEKPISEVSEGDQVVGYRQDNGRWILEIATVLKTHSVGIRPVVEGTTDAGRIFRCTEDHKWFTGRCDETHRVYNPAKIGRKIISVYTPSKSPSMEQQRLYDWLGGMFDGEGSCIGNPSISQSSANREVCAEIERALGVLGIPYDTQFIDRERERWSHGRNYVLGGGRSTKIRLLKHCHMVKRQRFVDSMWRQSRRVATRGGVHKTVSIVPIGDRPVFGLTTTTGNYIAWGYASQNSAHFLNNPVDPDAVRFRSSWLKWFSINVWNEAEANSAYTDPAYVANSQQWKNGSGYNHQLVRSALAAEASGAIPLRLKAAIHHEVQTGEVIEDIRAGVLERVAILDPNHSQEAGRSRHAIVVLGYYNMPKQPRRIYLLDAWAKSCSFEEMIDRLIGTRPDNPGLAFKWRVHHIYLESEVAGQQGWKFYFKEKVQQMGHAASFTIRPLKTDRSANAKQKRIIGMEPIYENGLFYVRRQGCEVFTQEYETFPNGQTMDVLDVVGYAPQTWEPGSRQNTRDFVKQELNRRTQMVQSMGQAGY